MKATYCGYRMDNPVLALRYAKLAKRDTLKLELTLQYVSQAWLRLKDDASYIATLQEGFQLFPKSGYFFPRLMDSYTSKGNYTKALSVADEALANAGTAYLNIALNMDARKYRKQIRKMYQQAMPYMETYRKLAPDERQKWGPALYRIYFNLNMGKQFDEIDKILKK